MKKLIFIFSVIVSLSAFAVSYAESKKTPSSQSDEISFVTVSDKQELSPRDKERFADMEDRW